MGDPFTGREMPGDAGTGAEPERIAGYEHDDGPATMLQQWRDTVFERDWPRYDRTGKLGQ